MKKALSVILVICILFSSVSFSFADGGMSNFKQERQYTEQFTDVRTSDWFHPYVAAAYEYGLVSGSSATTYNPNGKVTLAETLVIACQIHSIYHGTTIDRDIASWYAWYQPYVSYAISNQIISGYNDYTKPATRADFAAIMASALPEEEYPLLSFVPSIPDVSRSAAFAKPIYTLYQAGIVSGSDEYGTFHPDSNIRRSEVAVIALNIVDPSRRKANKFKTDSAQANQYNITQLVYAMTDPRSSVGSTTHPFKVNEAGAKIIEAGMYVNLSILDEKEIVAKVEWKCDNPGVDIEDIEMYYKEKSYSCRISSQQGCGEARVDAVITFVDGSTEIWPEVFTFQKAELSQDDIQIHLTYAKVVFDADETSQIMGLDVYNQSDLPIYFPESIKINGYTFNAWVLNESYLILQNIPIHQKVNYRLNRKSGWPFDPEKATAAFVIKWCGDDYYIECDLEGITYFTKGDHR